MSAVRDAIVLHLQADAAGVMSVATDVYPGTPPEGASHPLVTVDAHQPPRAHRVFQALDHEDSKYLVKGADKSSSPKRVGDLNRKIRARLDGADISVEGYDTQLVAWVEDVEYDETQPDGSVVRFEGGIYEVMVEPA